MTGLTFAACLSVACLAALGAAGRLRFLSAEFPSIGSRVLAGLLLVAVFTVCIFLPIATTGVAAEFDPKQLWFPELFASHLVLLLFLGAWWRLAPSHLPTEFLHLRGAGLSDVATGFRLGLSGWLLTIMVTAALSGALAASGFVDPTPATPEIPPILPWLAHLPLWRKLVVIAIAMTIEEAFFRAFLQTRIGWIPSSLLFSLSHASYGLPMLLFSVLILSLLIGWSLRRTGRLLPCIVAHGTFDAIQLLVVLPWAVDQLAVG